MPVSGSKLLVQIQPQLVFLPGYQVTWGQQAGSAVEDQKSREETGKARIPHFNNIKMLDELRNPYFTLCEWYPLQHGLCQKVSFLFEDMSIDRKAAGSVYDSCWWDFYTFLYEEPLAHFCEDMVVTPSMSLANDMALQKAIKLAWLFVNVFSWVGQGGEDQTFVTNTPVCMITAVSQSVLLRAC